MRIMTLEEFRSTLLESEYGKQYLDLIDKVRSEHRTGKVGPDGEMYERHHVHPRAFGGSKGELLRLTCYEHCVVHTLLARAIPCPESLYPIQLLCRQVKTLSDLEKITLEEIYEWSRLKKEANKARLGQNTWIKGRIQIHKGEEGSKRVLPEELQSYLDAGWEMGYPESRNIARRGRVGTVRGRVTMTDGTRERKVKPEDVDQLLAEGWRLGQPKAKVEARNAKLKGNCKGFLKIHKPETRQVKRVPSIQLESYLEQGWVKGNIPGSCKGTTTGRTAINNGEIVRKVKANELEQYLKNGWKKGYVKASKE